MRALPPLLTRNCQRDTSTYGNSEHSETECKRLLAAAIAAGVVDADAKPSKLVYANGQWQIMAQRRRPDHHPADRPRTNAASLISITRA